MVTNYNNIQIMLSLIIQINLNKKKNDYYYLKNNHIHYILQTMM